jgi:hypothetical protein
VEAQVSIILKPGQDPPTVTPYCQICGLPVERYQMDVVGAATGSGHIGIHAQCCDRTSSTRISLDVYLEMIATGKKLFVIVRKGSHAGLRSLTKPSLRSVAH